MKTKPITDHPAQMLLFADQRADSEKTGLHVGAGSTISTGGVPTPAAKDRRSTGLARCFEEMTPRQQMASISWMHDYIAAGRCFEKMTERQQLASISWMNHMIANLNRANA